MYEMMFLCAAAKELNLSGTKYGVNAKPIMLCVSSGTPAHYLLLADGVMPGKEGRGTCEALCAVANIRGTLAHENHSDNVAKK